MVGTIIVPVDGLGEVDVVTGRRGRDSCYDYYTEWMKSVGERHWLRGAHFLSCGGRIKGS